MCVCVCRDCDFCCCCILRAEHSETMHPTTTTPTDRSTVVDAQSRRQQQQRRRRRWCGCRAVSCFAKFILPLHIHTYACCVHLPRGHHVWRLCIYIYYTSSTCAQYALLPRDLFVLNVLYIHNTRAQRKRLENRQAQFTNKLRGLLASAIARKTLSRCRCPAETCAANTRSNHNPHNIRELCKCCVPVYTKRTQIFCKSCAFPR